MTRRANRLLLLALAVVSLTLYYGCSQTDDIVTPVSTSVLTLEASNLPTLPDGMVYELWAAREGDTLSIARFGYDEDNLTFLTEAGQPRSKGGEFEMGGDILAYEMIFISVENAGSEDDNLESPANIMVLAKATNPRDRQVELIMPHTDSMFYAAPFFCMQTPSDSNRNMSSIDAGVWFAWYRFEKFSHVEEIGIDTIIYDTIPAETIGKVYYSDYILDTANPLEIVTEYFTFDTVTYRQVRYTIESVIVTDTPMTVVNATVEWVEGDSIYRLIDDFSQGQDGMSLEDYSQYGFQYRGWVMAPAVATAGASVGQWTPPPWYNDNIPLTVLNPDLCGLISTGAFTRIDQPDDGNPYSAGPRVPEYPGEDFLINLPNNAEDTLNLIADATQYFGQGNVLISLEPMNYKDSTTNFPLILFVGWMPPFKSQLLPDSTASEPEAVYEPMQNFTSPEPGVRGTPRIVVDIERY